MNLEHYKININFLPDMNVYLREYSLGRERYVIVDCLSSRMSYSWPPLYDGQVQLGDVLRSMNAQTHLGMTVNMQLPKKY